VSANLHTGEETLIFRNWKFINRSRSFAASCLLIGLGLGSSAATAQPKPWEFFEPGFVDSDRSRSGDTKKQPAAPSSPRFTELDAAEDPVAAASAAQRATSVAGAEGTPVLWLTGIINAVDKAHLDKAYSELAVTLNEKKVPLGAIFLIGSVYDFSAEERESFVRKYGIDLGTFRETVPEVYATRVTRSPTWVLQTDEGQILLEAISPLHEYFNENGEFVDISAVK
jgi:hypothetical protein